MRAIHMNQETIDVLKACWQQCDAQEQKAMLRRYFDTEQAKRTSCILDYLADELTVDIVHDADQQAITIASQQTQGTPNLVA